MTSMKLVNKTRNKIIASDIKVRKTIWGEFIGLRFYPKLKDDEAMVFNFSKQIPVSVDMFFVFYPIDVLFLDKDMKVIGMKKNFWPFAMMWKSIFCKHIVELKKGRIDATHTRIGDSIKLYK